MRDRVVAIAGRAQKERGGKLPVSVKVITALDRQQVGRRSMNGRWHKGLWATHSYQWYCKSALRTLALAAMMH